ncbi:MAG: biotin--[acetyl-CoA-carboxylase] ligase [Steroidobacteraceae bacterium]|jgi:BirA family biotin operon repressor/biotin-[acetyl-CoA-carboxylase] ligase
MNQRREALVRLLADGREHSGEALARQLNISRAAVWKHVRTLAELGLAVHSTPGRGYQLDRSLDLLDTDLLSRSLGVAADVPFRSIRICFDAPSTNSELLAAGPPPPGLMDLCVAEHQSSGRGRRGRNWLAPLASGLCLSVSWSFTGFSGQIAALSLVVGVATAMALESLNIPGVMLKWPNDLWVNDRKLGGILVEMRAEAAGSAFVVIGIGLNVDLPAAVRTAILQEGVPAIDLREVWSNPGTSRTLLAARIVSQLLGALRQFGDAGFEPFRSEWRRRDALIGRSVAVQHADGRILGTARGIADDGALLVATASGVERLLSGDVSVRVSGT